MAADSHNNRRTGVHRELSVLNRSGTWFWNGAGGFKSIQREVYGVPLSNGPNTFTGTYIDSNSCTSTQNFVITVASAGPSFTLKSSAATLPITQGSTREPTPSPSLAPADSGWQRDPVRQRLAHRRDGFL